MARPPRIDYPGARHHVFNRGARKAPVLATDGPKSDFLGLVGELPERFGVRVHGFAVLSNHYHLMLETPNANLSRAMRDLGGRFSRLLNEAHGWDGPVMQGRFRSRVAEDEAYWRHLLAYLHLNPLRAHAVQNLDQAIWTSHRYYAGDAPAPEWLHTAELLELMGGAEGYRDYVDDVHKRRRPDPPGFDEANLWSGPPVIAAPTTTKSRELQSAREALAQVAEVTGQPVAQLTARRVGRRGNPGSWLAAWWLSRTTELRHAQIGELLGCRSSGVSQRLTRALTRRRDDPQFARWMIELEGRV